MSAISIDSAKIDASISILRKSVGPLTLSEIGRAALGSRSNAESRKQLVAELSQLPAESGVYEWPFHKRSRIYCSLPLRAAVAEALVQALSEQPLTARSASKPVSRILKRVSEAYALTEIRAAAADLVSASRILAFPVNRQTIIYFSFDWLVRQMPAQTSERPLAMAILNAVRQLQSSQGDFVRIDHLRNAPSLRRMLDSAVIELADSGKLVLTRYNGPRPVPDETKTNYIEDKTGELFIGAASPRPEAAEA